MEEVKALVVAIKAHGSSLPVAQIKATTEALTDNCIPEAGLKALFKHLSHLMLHYPNNKQCRLELINLMVKLQKTHASCVKHCFLLCQDLDKYFLGAIEQSISIAHECIIALRCMSAQLVNCAATVEANELTSTLHCFAQLINIHYVPGVRYGVKKAAANAAKAVFKLPSLRKICLQFVGQQSPNSSLIAFCSQLVLFHHKNGIMSELDDKTNVLQHYTQSCFITKSAISEIHLNATAELTALIIDKELMQQQQLIAMMQKAVLRSPEIALPSIAMMIKHLSIDLSQCSSQLLDSFCTHLLAESDSVRNGTANCIQLLANQIGDSAQYCQLVKRVCDQLLGNRTKLVNPKHKLTLIQLISGLSSSPAAPAAAVISLIDCIIEFITNEVQEASILEAVICLNGCCVKLNDEDCLHRVTKFLIANLQKKQVATIRLQILWCLRNLYCNRSMCVLKPLQQLLIDAITRDNKPATAAVAAANAAAATAAAAAAAGESVVAMELAIRMHNEAIDNVQLLIDTAINNVNRVLSDYFVRQLIINEQLQQCCTQSLLHCIGELLSEFSTNSSIMQSSTIALAAMATATPAATNATGAGSLRWATCRHLKRQLASLSGPFIASAVLPQVHKLIVQQQQQLQQQQQQQQDESSSSSSSSLQTYDVAKSFAKQLFDSSAIVADNNAQLLLLCYHDSALHRDADAWLHCCCLQQQQSNTKPLLPSTNQLLRHLMPNGFEQRPTPLQVKAVMAVCKFNAAFANTVAQSAIDRLCSTDIQSITTDDVALMNTPEGQLFDQSVLQEALEAQRTAELSSKNMRRENKLYSYADQMAEMQLRQELEEKKRKKSKSSNSSAAGAGGVGNGIQLDKKQAERVAEQIAAETAKRHELLPLASAAEAAFDQLQCAVAALPSISDHQQQQQLLQQLLRISVRLLHLPLTAVRAVQLLELIVTTVSDIVAPKCASVLTDSIVFVRALFRIEQPAIVSDKTIDNNGIMSLDWDNDHVVQHVLQLLQQQEQQHAANPLLFRCRLPLLRSLLLNPPAALTEAAATTAALNAIEQHCQQQRQQQQQQYLAVDELVQLLTQKLPISSQALRILCDCIGNEFPISDEAAQCLLQSLLCNDDTAAAYAVLSSLHSVTLADDCVVRLQQQLQQHLFLAKQFADEPVQELANSLWDKLKLQSAHLDAQSLMQFLLRALRSQHNSVRQAAAQCVQQCVQQSLVPVESCVNQLFELYNELSYRPPAVYDEFKRLVKEQAPDEWQSRMAIVHAIQHLLGDMDKVLVLQLFDKLVNKYLRDESNNVKDAMLKLGQKAIERHGAENLAELVQLFEQFLRDAPNTEAYDSVRQGVVILLGQLARFLDPATEEQKIRKVFVKLLDTLSFPSQTVQEAVSSCLPPLMSAMRNEKDRIIEKLMTQVLEADSYAERKGAAYGLAGVTKGVGIAVLKELQINQRLLDAMKDKKNQRRREGALLALEQICYIWGRLFEPYVVNILPNLLICCGDSNTNVRQAADDCSIAVMSKLSNHGVKLVLPSLLNTLAEDNWRTKCASADLLGSMSYCAPKQLSACLPQIVPKLMEVLTDSHRKVQQSGEEALGKIGKVITNAEVKGIVPQLLEAIKEPDRNTTSALQLLLSVKFIHKIDTASLALIMPVVGRAFRDTSTDTRKTAAQIVGNIYRLTERNDLTPYMEAILPGLKRCLLDPVPDVRAVAAKALGSMVKEMGEASFQDLFPWLMSTLVTEDSAINRAGAAQGLAEIIGGAGSGKLESLIPEMISTAEEPDIAPHVRDGYLMLFIYLPRVFPQEFSQYVGDSLPPILKGLANENEFVRETALRAGQILVQMYCNMAISLLLPELERGMFDDNWRIRYSSVQLLGDLLYNLSGVSGKGTTVTNDEDDTFGSSDQYARIGKQLGDERRSQVLAGLYIARSDSALLVRQAANHVWKVIVPHTPRTLQAIMPVLLPTLLGNLASDSTELREVSAKTLGDIVRKLGDRILPHMMLMLQTGLDSDESKQREGVCLALSEIMRSVQREHMLAYADQLVPTVRKALTDQLPAVRLAASRTFALLYSVIGQRALDDIVMRILSMLSATDDHDGQQQKELALDGLKQAMTARSDVVLPYIVPKLVQPPVNIQALAVLASVAGTSLTHHLGKILPALVSGLDVDNAEQLQQCQLVLENVDDDQAVIVCVRQLTSTCDLAQNIPLKHRLAAMRLLHALTDRDDIDLLDHREAILRACVRLYCVQGDAGVLKAAHDCLLSLVNSLDKTELPDFVNTMRTAIKHVLSEPHNRLSVNEVPGFCCTQPKGISPVLTVYREGLLSGTVDHKESASIGLRELIERTSAEALKSSVVHITGPLIRVLGDRYSSSLKSAVIDALSAVLHKCANIMKPFLPQLQLTFFKALADQTQSLRLKAAVAIGQLSCVHAKPDQLLAELLSQLTKPENVDAVFTNLQAIRNSCEQAGNRLNADTCLKLHTELMQYNSSDDEQIRLCSGVCIGLLAGSEQGKSLQQLRQYLISDGAGSVGGAEWTGRQSRLYAICAYLSVVSGDDDEQFKLQRQKLESVIELAVSSDRQQLVEAGVRCCAQALCKFDSPVLLQSLVKSQKHDSTDVKLLFARLVSHIVEYRDQNQIVNSLSAKLLTPLVNGTRERNSSVKSASEQAIADLCALDCGIVHSAQDNNGGADDDGDGDGKDPSRRCIAQQCINQLDAAMRDSVQQVVDKLSKRQWIQTKSKTVPLINV